MDDDDDDDVGLANNETNPSSREWRAGLCFRLVGSSEALRMVGFALMGSVDMMVEKSNGG